MTRNPVSEYQGMNKYMLDGGSARADDTRDDLQCLATIPVWPLHRDTPEHKQKNTYFCLKESDWPVVKRIRILITKNHTDREQKVC